MPIYTYRCESCGVQFDRRQKFSDEPLKICPECQTETLRKVYLPVGIVFKGSGFYATDNRSPSGRESRLSDDHAGGENLKRNQKKNNEGQLRIQLPSRGVFLIKMK
jgi:putative FmdB family regulatory protein